MVDLRTSHFLTSGHPAGAFYSPKIHALDFLTPPFSSFGETLTFGVTFGPIYPVEYVHMDHTDHLCFLGKVDFDCEKSAKWGHFEEKSLFEITL